MNCPSPTIGGTALRGHRYRGFRTTVLHVAASKGNLNKMARVLDNGHPIDPRDEEESTPLLVALACNMLESCRFLLARGADPTLRDYKMRSALHVASESTTVGTMQLLLDHGVDMNLRGPIGPGVLHLAAELGHEEMVNLLTDSGSDLEAKAIDGTTPLHTASMAGQKGVVKLLVSRGANVDALCNYGRSPLWYATRYGHLKIVMFLAARTKDLNTQVYTGPTALSTAARYGHTTIAKALLDAGAEVFPQEPGPHVPWLDPEDRMPGFGEDALTIACVQGYYDIVEMLLITLAKVEPEEHAVWLEVWNRAGPRPNRAGDEDLARFRDWYHRRQLLVEPQEIRTFRDKMTTKVYALQEEGQIQLGKDIGIPYTGRELIVDTLGRTHDLKKMVIIDSHEDSEAASESDGPKWVSET